MGIGGNAVRAAGGTEEQGNMVAPFGGLFGEGMKGDTVTQNSNSASTSGIKLGAMSELEKLAGGQVSGNFQELMKMLNSGPGQAEVDAGNAGQKDFVSMLKGINANGGMPTDEDRRQANIFADDMFKPQQEALNQSFTQQNEQAARLSAQLNRPVNDPIIQAKLRQEQMRQSSMLSADRTAFTANESRNSPFRRLELQGQLADAQSGLASQAMANRMQLLNLGNSLQTQERNWRLQTADRWGNSSSNSSQHSGGGIMGGIGAVTGAVSGFMNIANSGMSAMQGGSGQSSGAYADRPQQTMAPANYAQIQSQGWQGGPQGSDYSSYYAPQGASAARKSRLSSGASGSWAGGGSSGGGMMSKMGQIGGMATMFSDRSVKKNVKQISKADIIELKQTLKPYTFNYVSEEYGSGDWVGVMAQDLQKSKLGRTVITEVNGKLAIDQRKLNSLLLATLAEG